MTSFSSEKTDVNIPSEPSDAISLTGSTGAELLVNLPADLELNEGKASSNGTIVYQSKDNSVDAAVQSLESGSVRVQTIIRSASAPHEFSYGIGGGFQPVQASDGTFWSVGDDANGNFAAYAIQDAWARDASGNSVPTKYEIRGNDLVQLVMPTEQTEYPVIADPTWEWYNLAYGAGFNKQETKNLAGQAGLGFFCTALTRVGVGIAAPWCAIFGGAIFYNTKRMADANACVFVSAAPLPLAVPYNSKNCR